MKQIGNRFDKTESGDCKKTSDKSKIKSTKALPKAKKLGSSKSKQQPETFNENKLPILVSVKEDALIKLIVEQWLQELADLAKTGMNPKVK